MTTLRTLFHFIALLFACGGAAAHEIRPAIATLELKPDGGYELAISVNMEAVLAEVSPQHRDTDESPNAMTYNRLRALAPDALRKAIDAQAARYLDGIDLRFDGERVAPSISAVEVPEAGDVALSRQTVRSEERRVGK